MEKKTIKNYLILSFLTILILEIITIFFINPVYANQEILFHDDFESVNSSEYPPCWEILNNNWGSRDARVSDKQAHSGLNSFRLSGYDNEQRIDYIKINYSDQLTYEAYVYIVNSSRGAAVGFTLPIIDSPRFNSIIFSNDGKIYFQKNSSSPKRMIQYYDAQVWYKIHVDLNFLTQKASVYIDDLLKKDNVSIAEKEVHYYQEILTLNKFSLSTNLFEHGEYGIAYFDDIKLIYTAPKWGPDLLIKKMTIIPENPVVLNWTYVNVTVANIGTVSTTAFNVNIYIVFEKDDKIIFIINDTKTVGQGLATGSNTTISFRCFNVMSGSKTVRIIVDSSDIINELDENNNKIKKNFEIFDPLSLNWDWTNGAEWESEKVTLGINLSLDTINHYYPQHFLSNVSLKPINTSALRIEELSPDNIPFIYENTNYPIILVAALSDSLDNISSNDTIIIINWIADQNQGTIQIRLEKPGKQIPPIPPVLPSVIGIGTIISMAYIILTETGKYKLFSFFSFLIPLRLKPNQETDHETRRMLYNCICEEPGINFIKLKEQFNLSYSTISWHLRILEYRAEMIKSKMVGKYHLFYPRGINPRNIKPLSPKQKRILDLVNKSNGITQTEIYLKLNMSQQSTSYNLLELIKKEEIVLKKDKADGKKKYYPYKKPNDISQNIGVPWQNN